MNHSQWKVVVAIVLALPVLATAEPGKKKCKDDSLKGQYVLSASGFTRPPGSLPNTPWVPKAIIEVLHFNGDGTLTTPGVAIANPFGDLGNVVLPPAGAPGTYSINDDCSGSVEFLDANHVMWKMFVDSPEGHTVWMIQTNPGNNVIQGMAKRVQ
jgi:hypothetical protein